MDNIKSFDTKTEAKKHIKDRCKYIEKIAIEHLKKLETGDNLSVSIEFNLTTGI